MAPDRELMGDRLALAGQLMPFGHLEEEFLLLSNRRIHRNCCRGRFLLAAGSRKRLGAFRIVPIDGHGFQAQLPGFNVGLYDILDRGFLRHVDRLTDCSREEGLHGSHHLQVTVPGNRAPATKGRERTIKNGQVLKL